MAVKICPKCKGKVSEARNICPHCDYDFSKRMIVCPDCESEVEDGLAECPVCGHYFDVTDARSDDAAVEPVFAPLVKAPIQESNPNSPKVYLANFHRTMTKEQFLRSVLIELSLDPQSPTDILSAEFGDVEESEIQGYLIQGVANGTYSGLIGIDRVEEYVTQEQKYVPSGTHYTSGGIGFYEKEGARHLVDVTKTRTVTDWQGYSGQIINEHHSAVKTELGYEDFESSFWKLFRRDDLDKIHDESVDDEKLPDGFYDKGMDLLRQDVVNRVPWPGDHHKDERCSVSISNYKIYRCIVPTYQVSCVYKGQACLIQGFAIDQIAPVIEKRVSTSSNSVEGLKREEDVEINKKEKITLSAKIVAILAAISGFIGFIILVSGGEPLPLFIGFLAGIAASICLGVVALVSIASIKKKYEKKTQQLSYMKYILLKQELDKRGFPQLTDEEKDDLQCSMGIDSLDDIDDTLLFEEFDSKGNKKEVPTIKEESGVTSTKKAGKSKSTKQNLIFAIFLALNNVFALTFLTFTFMRNLSWGGFYIMQLYFAMPVQYFAMLIICVCSIVFDVMAIISLLKSKMSEKRNQTVFISSLLKILISVFLMVDNILYMMVSLDAFEWISVFAALTVIVLSVVCIRLCHSKAKRETWIVTKSKVLMYTLTVILSVVLSVAHILVLNSEKMYVNKFTNEVYHVNYFGQQAEVVTIPDGVTSFCHGAFRGCNNLTSVTIPDSVTSIGSGAFSGCTSLTSVTIPDSVTNIDYHTFEGCTSLTSVTIPDSVTSIGAWAFEGCPIEYVTVPASLIDSVPKENLKTVVINGGESIGDGAFSGCTGLTSITIPSSVTSIGSYAFSGCTSLESIKFRGTEAQWEAITKDYSWNNNVGSYTMTYNYTEQ